MSGTCYWMGAAIAFHPGETIAATLRRAGVDDFGAATGALRARYFCGVGACQSCLVSVDDACPVEACLTPAKEGMRLGLASPHSVPLHDD